MVRTSVVYGMMAVAAINMFAQNTEATLVTFKNMCSYPIALYDNAREEGIAPGAVVVRDLPVGYKGMFRHGANPQATRKLIIHLHHFCLIYE